MSEGVQVAGVYVRDQDEALDFYVGKLGFEVHTDVRNGDYRWLTVRHPEQPTFQLGLFRPQAPIVDDATAQLLKEAVAKGAMPPLVLVVEDCRAAYDGDARARRRVHAGTDRALRQCRCELPRSFRQRVEDARTAALMAMCFWPGFNGAVMEKEKSGSEAVDEKLRTLSDWRGAILARLRRLIHEADPKVEEAVKWRKPSNPLGVPTWEHDGIICTGETYKDKVKLTFAYGASLKDRSKLFNSSLGGGTRRAIDLREGDALDETAFKALIREAVALNGSRAPR